MSYYKIQELAFKFADRADSITHKPIYLGDDDKFHAQRARLEEFFFDFYQGLRRSLNEIEGDILSLKEAKMDPSVLKVLGQVFHQLNDITRQANPENPYLTVKKLLEWLNSKTNKSIIDNLQFIITNFLRNRKLDIKTNKRVSDLTINGLNNTIKEIEKAKMYMDAFPMLPDPRDAITVPPPKLLSEQTSVSSLPAPDHNKETMPDVYEALKNLKQISNK
jgi:hypothetical protein